MSQVVALVKRLEEAEKTIEDLRARRAVEPSATDGTTAGSPSVRMDLLQPAAQPGFSPLAGPPGDEMTSSNVPATGVPAILDQEHLPPDMGHTNHDSPHISTKEPVPTELSVDEDGKINYYGPTSAVHEPPQPSQVDSPESQASTGATERADARASLAAHARETATWEEFALGNAALQTGIPRQLMAKLLHIHWTWVSPMFMWVYKPAFIREHFLPTWDPRNTAADRRCKWQGTWPLEEGITPSSSLR